MSKIPSYYNNFKNNKVEGKPEDMVSWKAWLAASAAALFGMSASAEGANYAGELKPVVRRQQFEIAAVPQQTINDNVARISDSLTGENSDLTEEAKAYIKMLEKKVADNTEEKKKENKKPTAFENAVDGVANEIHRSLLDNIVGALLGNN